MPKRRLHSAVLSSLFKFLDYETIIDILCLSGDKHLKSHFVHHGALTEVVATTKKSITLLSRLFGFHLPFSHLTRLVMDCPLAVVPILPIWTGDLPPTLVEIRFHFKGSAEVWLRPVDVENDDQYVKYVSSGNSYTSESMKERFPRLEILECEDEEVIRGQGEDTVWNDPMKQRFMNELPPSLTSLRLDGFYCASGRYPMLPPLLVFQHLTRFSMAVGGAAFGDLLATTSSPSSDNLLKGSVSKSSSTDSLRQLSPSASPSAAPSRKQSSSSSSSVAPSRNSLAAFLSLTSLELRAIKYDHSAGLFKFLTSLQTLLLDFDLDDRNLEEGRNLFEPPSSLTSLSLAFSLSEINPLLPALPASLTTLRLKVAQDGTEALNLSDLPIAITQLEIATSNNARLGALSGLPPNLRLLNLSLNFAQGFELLLSHCEKLHTLIIAPEERADFGEASLPKHSLTHLSTGNYRPLTATELQSLPTTIKIIEGCFRVDHTLLTRETKHWNDQIATNLIKSRFLSHLSLHKLHLTIQIDQRFLNSLPQTQMEDIVCSDGAVNGTTQQNALLFPPTLTTMAGITMSRPIDTLELPRGLIELDAAQWKWHMPHFGEDHKHEKKSSVLQSVAELLTPGGHRKKISAESGLPPHLRSLVVSNPTTTFQEGEDLDYSFPFHVSLLATVPLLEVLTLHVGASGEAFIAQLPRTLTDLTLQYKYPGQGAPLTLAAEAWPPRLRHLRLSHGPLHLSSLRLILPHLRTLYVDELRLSGPDAGSFAEDTTRLDSAFLRRHCRFSVLPRHTHVKHTIIYVIEWTKQTLLQLPRGLHTAVLKSFDPSNWSSARREFGLWLPPTLVKLNIGHWPAVHPKVTSTLPRTLQELLVTATDFNTDSYRHLPPGLLCLSLYAIDEFGPEEADALPKGLQSLAICSKRYKSGTFILFPQSLLRISFGDTEDEISETQLKHLPKSLLRVELGFPERHREETTFGARLKAFARVLKQALPSLVYFGYTRDPADNLLTVK